EKGGGRHASRDERGNAGRRWESKDRPNGRGPTGTGRTGIHLGRFGVIAPAAFAIGLPVIVVILMERNAPIWPYVPVVLGSWVIVVPIVRVVIQHKTVMSNSDNTENSRVRSST